jgi:hypothetical protein
MNSSKDCPKIEGWVAIRVGIQLDHHQQGPDQQKKNNTYAIQADRTFRKAYLRLNEGCMRWYEDNLTDEAKGCGFIASKIVQEAIPLDQPNAG